VGEQTPTLPIPVVSTAHAAPRPKRRTAVVLWSVAGGLVILVVIGLVSAFFVEKSLRQEVIDRASAAVRQGLSLDTDHPVRVDLAERSMIAQVLSGTLDTVAIAVDDVAIGALAGSLTITANGVPTDDARAVADVAVEFRVSEASVEAISKSLSGAVIQDVRLENNEVTFASEFSILGLPLEVGVGMTPAVSGGAVVFSPSSLELGGNEISVDGILDSFGGLARTLLTTQPVCLADRVPAVLTVDDVAVGGNELVVTLSAVDAIFDDASLATVGNCTPAQTD
jgi:LmeA-like phospholipid-binding